MVSVSQCSKDKDLTVLQSSPLDSLSSSFCLRHLARLGCEVIYVSCVCRAWHSLDMCAAYSETLGTQPLCPQAGRWHFDPEAPFLPIQEHWELCRVFPYQKQWGILTPSWPSEQLKDVILWHSTGKNNSLSKDAGIVGLQENSEQRVLLQLLFTVNFRAGIPC